MPVLAEQVVISKIMYHPPGAQPEYVELFNNTATPFDLANWRLAGGAHFDFPSFSTNDPQRTFLKPFERIVLCGENPELVRAAWKIPAGIRLYGPWTGKLDNGGERLTLKDKNGVALCTVHYGTRGHWPLSADGAGHGLVLKDANRSVDDWRNWTASDLPGGSPGLAPIPAKETPATDPGSGMLFGATVLEYGATWRFEDNPRDPGIAWRQPGFDDSAWAAGRGPLGFGALGLPPVGTRLKARQQITCCFRTQFVFHGDPAEMRVVADQFIDDGAIYFLNGQEIARVRMPPGEAKFDTLSPVSVRTPVEELNAFIITNALWRGTNVLAVEVHQVKTNSSDLMLGLRLRAFPASRSGLVINELFPGPKGFVEFYNPASNAVDLKGFFLSDDPANLRKFPIPSALVAAPGKFASVDLPARAADATNALVVVLTEPDGVKIVAAAAADFSTDRRAVGRKPAGGRVWLRFPEPTRNAPNAREIVPGEALRLNEVHFAGAKAADWIELFNLLDTPASAQGLFLASNRDLSDQVPLDGVVPARGCRSWPVPFTVKKEGFNLFLVNAARTVLQSRAWAAPVSGEAWQAFPDGGGEWYASARPTRDAANAPARSTDIVINEIMFDPPSVLTNAAQFLELFNRGKSSVDLSGWEFVEGVTFVFPKGATIPAGGHLVVTSDTNAFRPAYGKIPALGNFQGRLRHRGELVRLVDRAGNLANQVDYRVGGNWPERTAGGGSSLELINPWMDNSLASAWRDSDESNKSVLREYRCTGRYEEMHVKGGPSDFKELHLHLVGDGHLLLENISLCRTGATENLIVNGTKLSDDGFSAQGWLVQGTHHGTFVTNGQLHLVSEGRGDNRANRAEIDLPGLNKGDTCELKFRARWLSGKPRLIAQTWDHSLAHSFLIDVPPNLGTPGKSNSRFTAAPAPQVDALAHHPPVPRATDPVNITAKISSVAPLQSVQVIHRLATAKGDTVWTNAPMHDDGLEGDAVTGDGIFTAELPPQAAGQVVEFYVQAIAKNGLTCLQPRGGRERPGLYVADDRTIPRDLRTARFVISPHALTSIADGNNTNYGFKFPRHSNRYWNATWLHNEEEIFYNVEVRNSGSPWTRGGGLDRPKFKFPGDQLFRSHDHYYFDNDAAGGNFHNRVVRYWLYLLGHPSGENEVVREIVNHSGIELREDTEPVGTDFVSRVFKNGNRGQLYRIDDEWWFADNWERDPRDADWGYKGSDNPGRYRTEWMKRSHEAEDDFTDLIAFFKLHSSNRYTQEQIEKFLEPRQILPYTVVRGYISDWDTFTMGRGKNAFFYQHPDHGPFQFLQWDSDLGFTDPNSGFYGGRVQPWLERPYNRRLFHYYLAELHENYAKNSARFTAWLQAEATGNKSYAINTNFYLTWCSNREPALLRELGPDYQKPLAITPVNAGQPVTNAVITLTGTAPFTHWSVELEPKPAAPLIWKDHVTWACTNIALAPGANRFVLQGRDKNGKVTAQTNALVMRVEPPPAR